MASALVQRGSLAAKEAYGILELAQNPKGTFFPELNKGDKGDKAATDDRWKLRRSEALADLEKGLKLSPKQPQAQFEIAKLNLLPGGDKAKAIEALDKTIALAGDDANLHAEALLRRGHVAERRPATTGRSR